MGHVGSTGPNATRVGTACGMMVCMVLRMPTYGVINVQVSTRCHALDYAGIIGEPPVISIFLAPLCPPNPLIDTSIPNVTADCQG